MEKNCDIKSPSNHVEELQCIESVKDTSTNGTPSNRNSIPITNSHTIRNIHYAGLLIFSPFIIMLSELHKNGGFFLKQWFSFFLTSVVNIEQSKYIDFDSLSWILGKTMSNLQVQRDALSRISNEHLRLQILSLNKEITNINSETDFYYDPHTKHYTGEYKILKGWCSATKGIDKVLHSDYIHTIKGLPVFMSYNDNYYDLREEERYLETINGLKDCYGIKNVITVVFDRGIYSLEIFLKTKSNSNLDIITWEKGYKPQNNLSSDNWESFSIKRYRNNSNDIKKYNIQYFDGTLERDQTLRKLIVRATNPKKKTIEVAILTTDMSRDAKEIITLIFNRWIQENSFKYLIEHFGINEITSYDTIDYSELKGLLRNKDMVNGKYKALLSLKKIEINKIEKLLFKQHYLSKKKKKLSKIDNEIKTQFNVESGSEEQFKALKKSKTALKISIKKLQKQDFELQIEVSSNELDNLKNQMENTQKEISRLANCIDQKYKKLDTRKKSLFDAIKILAHNCYWYYFKTFRKEYNNFRDDHSYFRHITRSNGIVIENKNEVTIYLKPIAHIPPKIRNILEKLLEDIQNKTLEMPDGSNRALYLKLLPKSGVIPAIENLAS
jgi:hypothetical protein